MSLSFSGQFFMAMVLDKAAPHEFHVKVWELAQPQLFAKATQLKVKDDNGRFNKAIAFADEADFHKFNSWWRDYKILVGEAINYPTIPEPGDGEVISGVMVKHDPCLEYGRDRLPRPEEFLDDWVWIVESCSSKVWWTPCHWIFQSQEEAVMFKLHIEPNTHSSRDREDAWGVSYEPEYESGDSDFDHYNDPVRSLEDLINRQLNKKPRW